MHAINNAKKIKSKKDYMQAHAIPYNEKFLAGKNFTKSIAATLC